MYKSVTEKRGEKIMFRKMRRFKQLLTEEETREIISSNNTGILGVIGDEGYPYTVPVNHVLSGDTIYFHSAKAGHKVDAINNNPKASFTVIDKDDIVQEEATTYFRSAHAFGKAYVVTDEEERLKAMELIYDKTCPDAMYRKDNVIKEEGPHALIIGIKIEHMTGKEAIELVRLREK